MAGAGPRCAGAGPGRADRAGQRQAAWPRTTSRGRAAAGRRGRCARRPGRAAFHWRQGSAPGGACAGQAREPGDMTRRGVSAVLLVASVMVLSLMVASLITGCGFRLVGSVPLPSTLAVVRIDASDSQSDFYFG